MFAQPADRPKFEVATIKPTADKLRSSAGMRPLPGGRLHGENMPARMLIMRAYHVQDFQIVGGPDWLRNEGFDIEAKGEPNATNAQIMLMLQPLLEERLQLKYHRETRDLPVYALTGGKSGSKLPHPKEGGCVKVDGTTPLAPTAIPCGSLRTLFGPKGITARGGDLPMQELIRMISEMLGRPVLDKTGITTHFDLNLEFAVDDTLVGFASEWGTVAGHRESMMTPTTGPGASPTLLVAVQEQLGLKLESTKGPVEVMVIDHVERPLPN
jgi:uncharacterized protein (TIGR03435 family)